MIAELHAMEPPPARVPGTAVYLNARRETTPLALRRGLEHTRALHESIVIVSILTEKAPCVPERERLAIDPLGFEDDGVVHLTAHYGFQDRLDVPRLVVLAREAGVECEIDVTGAVYILFQVSVIQTAAPGMRAWRKHLFAALYRNAASPVGYFHLPPERTVTLGSAIEL